MSPRPIFDSELAQLEKNVEVMGAQVEATFDRLMGAMERGDYEAVLGLTDVDCIVKDMERGIESKCLTIITKQQPVAKDLRMVSSVLKAVTDLERSGGHVADIAELLARYPQSNLSGISVHLQPMADAAKALLHDGVEAFVTRKMAAAQEVIEGDDIIDELFNKVKLDVVDSIRTEKRTADECVDIIMIAKYFEKIGDHAVNIAQWAVFRETGSIGNVRLL